MKKRTTRLAALLLACVLMIGMLPAALAECTAVLPPIYNFELPTDEQPEPPQPAPELPTEAPTETPTEVPTEAPTEAPTESPTEAPTESPTEAPTAEPTTAPTARPTARPTQSPAPTADVKPTPDPANGPIYDEDTGVPVVVDLEDSTTIIEVENLTDIESEHPYANDLDVTWVYTRQNAQFIALTFSEETKTESYFDNIIIYDKDDEIFGTYSGTQLADQTLMIPGDTVKVRLKSDYSLNFYGLKVVDASAMPSGCDPIPAAYANSSTEIRLELPARGNSLQGYEIFRSDAPNGTYTQVGTTSANTFTTAALFGKTNYFKIRGYCDINGQRYTTAFSQYRSMYCLSTPSLYQPEAQGDTAMAISFKGVANATAYRIYVASSSEDFDYQRYTTVASDGSGGNFNTVITGLTPGTTYRVRMRAVITLGDVLYVGPYGAVRTVLVGVNEIGAAPVMGPATVLSSTSLKITWQQMPGATGYELYRAGTHDGGYTRIASLNATEYIDNDPLFGRVNYYKVRAVYADGVSPMSVYRSTLGLSTPGISVMSDCKAGVGITVTFNTVAIANGYYISRGASKDGTFTRIGYIESDAGSGGTAEYNDLTAASGETWYYRIQAYYDNPINQTRYVGPLCVAKGHTQVPVYRAYLVVENDYADDHIMYRDDNIAMTNMMNQLHTTDYSIVAREDKTANEILSGSASAFADASADDISLFFFSSHGSSNGYLSCANDTWLNADSLRRALDPIPGKKVLVICACYSGNLIGKGEQDAWARKFNDTWIDAFAYNERDLLAHQDYYVLTSANGSEQSYSLVYDNNGAERHKISVLGMLLAKGCGWNYATGRECMMLADENYDGKVTLDEAYEYTYSAAFTTLNGATQHIQVYPENCPLVLFAE